MLEEDRLKQLEREHDLNIRDRFKICISRSEFMRLTQTGTVEKKNEEEEVITKNTEIVTYSCKVIMDFISNGNISIT